MLNVLCWSADFVVIGWVELSQKQRAWFGSNKTSFSPPVIYY